MSFWQLCEVGKVLLQQLLTFCVCEFERQTSCMFLKKPEERFSLSKLVFQPMVKISASSGLSYQPVQSFAKQTNNPPTPKNHTKPQ